MSDRRSNIIYCTTGGSICAMGQIDQNSFKILNAIQEKIRSSISYLKRKNPPLGFLKDLRKYSQSSTFVDMDHMYQFIDSSDYIKNRTLMKTCMGIKKVLPNTCANVINDLISYMSYKI